MLKLTRNPGAGEKSRLTITTESGDVIKIIILQSSSHSVQVGIDADKSVNIKRDELLSR